MPLNNKYLHIGINMFIMQGKNLIKCNKCEATDSYFNKTI